MINLDYVAYFVIYVCVAFAILPAMIDRGGIGYKQALIYSFELQFFIVALFVIAFVIVWALVRVFS